MHALSLSPPMLAVVTSLIAACIVTQCIYATILAADDRAGQQFTLLYMLQIWQMKQEEVHAVAHKLLAADRVIHEQQLGWQWRGPDEEALLAGPHSPQANRTLTGSRKKGTTSQKANSEVAENEEMPDGVCSTSASSWSHIKQFSQTATCISTACRRKVL